MMASPSGTGTRHRNTTRQHSAEDQALNQVAAEAESRLAIRRAARAEAREIRSRELERQKQEEEEREKDGRPDRVTELKREYSGSRFVTSSNGSRRGSIDSSDDGNRDTKKELFELEEKYKKAMMNNAQLDNEKQTLRYQVDALRDAVEDIDEKNVELQRELKEKTKECDVKRRDFNELEAKFKLCEEILRQRDELIKEHGFRVITDETLERDDDVDAVDGSSSAPAAARDGGSTLSSSVALLTPESIEILRPFPGTLDERLRKLADDKKALEKEIKKLKTELEDEREKRSATDKYTSSRSPKGSPVSNGPRDHHSADAVAELQRQMNDYKLKLKKAEQEIATLEGNTVRLESQVKRFKTAAENLEKVEEELKAEKRKFQKELRDVMAQKQELEMENSTLQKRLDRTKTSRSAIGK